MSNLNITSGMLDLKSIPDDYPSLLHKHKILILMYQELLYSSLIMPIDKNKNLLNVLQKYHPEALNELKSLLWNT